MRAFYRLIAMMAASLFVAALLTYPAWLATNLVSQQPLHRVLDRVAMAVAAVGLIWLLRYEKLGSREALGYTLPKGEFLRQLAVGFGSGLLLMTPLVVLLLNLGVRQLKPELAWQPLLLLAELFQGALTGLAVGFIEETFFRGAMQTVMTRDSAPRLAIVLPSIVYATVHFLGGKVSLPVNQIEWSSSFVVLANLFERFASPLMLLDSFLALFAVGLLLAFVRRYTGAIAACIGLHAGLISVITLLKSTTLHHSGTHWSWLVGAYDGVIGWGAFLLMIVVIGAFLTITAKAPDPRGLPVSM